MKRSSLATCTLRLVNEKVQTTSLSCCLQGTLHGSIEAFEVITYWINPLVATQEACSILIGLGDVSYLMTQPQPLQSFLLALWAVAPDMTAGEGHRRVEVNKKPVYTRFFPRAAGWSSKEDEALTEFVFLNTDGRAWPSIKSSRFLEGAAAFLLKRVGTKRTSGYDQTL